MTEQFVTWKQDYSVGVDEIDRQHRHLIDIINEFHNGVIGGGAQRPASFLKAIHQCVNYVKEHFSAEEQLMLDREYPEYKRHKEEHVHFIQLLMEDVAKFEGGDNFVPGRFAGFLVDWLLNHIALQDKRIGLFMGQSTAKK
jgi:hemerythrin